MASNRTEPRRFHLHDRIGTGGFGDVYRATLVSGGGVETMVAMKVLHKDRSPKGQALSRLRDEARVLGHLRHPAIVRVMDLVELDGRAALVTEYIEGVDLGVCFRQGGLGPRALVGIVAQVAAGLDAAWSAPVPGGGTLKAVHRDVKPENVRIGRQGDVKLLDFGIAKAGGVSREARTEAGDVVGSYRHMAPERLARSYEDAPEGDVYSLAAVLFEGLAGERLFAGKDLKGHVTIATDALSHNAFVAERLMAVERFGPVVQNLLSACLAYDPRLRPSAGKVAAVCDDLTDGLPGKNLRQWMRSWDWPEEDRGPGPLTGKVLMDAPSAPPEADRAVDNVTVMVFDDPTIESNAVVTRRSALSSGRPRSQMFQPPPKESPGPTARIERPVPPPPPSGSRMRAGVFFALFTAVVLGGSAVTGLLGALAIWTGRSAPVDDGVALAEGGVEPIEAPAPALAPAAEPVPAAEPEPEPPPATEEPVIPNAGVPEDYAPEGQRGRFTAEGRVPVELRRADVAVGPGEVPIGAWSVFADWGTGFEKTTAPPVVMFAGTTAIVRCNALKRLCEVEVHEAAEEGIEVP